MSKDTLAKSSRSRAQSPSTTLQKPGELARLSAASYFGLPRGVPEVFRVYRATLILLDQLSVFKAVESRNLARNQLFKGCLHTKYEEESRETNPLSFSV